MSNRVANGLRGLGLARGDRVGVILSQSLETCVAHLGIYKLGGIAVPMSVLFGPDALRHRLDDSGARAVVTDAKGAERIEEALRGRDDLTIIVTSTGSAHTPHRQFDGMVAEASARFDAVDTAADDPALLIYTSGTTGPPKGALHPPPNGAPAEPAWAPACSYMRQFAPSSSYFFRLAGSPRTS